MKKRILPRLIILLFLFLFSTANATVWYIHPDSTLNSIQAGLDSCNTDDTVLVGPGTYYENIIWPNTQGIVLVSEFYPDSTIIDGDSTGRVMEITTGIDSTTIINGFTIRNGYTSEDGGGIYCINSSPNITGNIITGNICTWMFADGGGIYCYNASPIINNNTITLNSTDASGGGIYCEYNSSPRITDNIIKNNSATDGGGIYCASGSSPIITRDTISANTSYGYYYGGGGIYCAQGSSPIIRGNIIYNNTTNAMGGGIYCDSPSAIMKGNIITNNTGFLGGGGIYCCSSPTISSNIINNNTTYYEGGGIHCDLSASPVIDSCTISSNDASGLYCEYDANPVIKHCNITNNTGYGVFNDDSDVTINAEYNWWGDSLGPGGVGPGSGDEVSNYVDYDPWLTDSVPVSGVEELEPDENVFFISKGYPNPFIDKTLVEYSLFKSCNVNISIYNTLGARIRVLLNESQNAGTHAITWNGRDASGNKVSSGFYFLRLEAEDFKGTRKLLLLR